MFELLGCGGCADPDAAKDGRNRIQRLHWPLPVTLTCATVRDAASTRLALSLPASQSSTGDEIAKEIDIDTLICTVITGVGATAVVDAWAIVRKQLLGVPAPDFGLVGRWIAYMPRGQFRHDSIKSAAAVPNENAIGWTAHYLIGIGFAGLLPTIWGADWFRAPTLAPAVLVGVVTVAAPFLLMQPGMGAGIAASRMPNPAAARLHSLLTHTIFGFGLFASGWALSRLVG